MTQKVTFENQKHSFPDDFTEEEIREALNATSEKNLYNAPIDTLKRSGKQFAKDVITPFTQPVETAQSIWELGKSIKNLLFVEGKQENEKVAIAMGEFFKDRYGGIENIKKTFRTDPVGFVADLSLLISGGAMLPARAPGIVGQTSKVIGQAGRAIDPIVASAKAIKSKPIKIKGTSYGTGTVVTGLGNAISEVFGFTTGAGGKAIRTAYGAGYAGGDKARAVTEGRSQNVGRVNKVADDLIKSLDELDQQYSTIFKNSDIGKKLRKTTISAKDINKVLKNIEKKGKQDGKWKDVKDKEIFDKINAIKTNIWQSTQRRNGIGADDLIKQLDNLLLENNSKVIRDTQIDIKKLINDKVPDYTNKIKSFDAISEAKQTAKTITNANDADKILNNIKIIFDKNTQQPVLRDKIRNLDKMKNLNIEEVVTGDKMSGAFPTSANLYSQGIKMGGMQLDIFGAPIRTVGAISSGGPFSPIFSPNMVSRLSKRAGEIKRYGPKPLVNTLRGNRALQSTEDDEVFYTN